MSSDDEATGTPYSRDAMQEDGVRQTLTGRRLKRKRSDRGSVSPRDPGADGHEVDADEEDAESVETPEEEDEDVGEEHTKEHISAAEDSCESPSQDENVLDAMEGDDEKTASDASVDAGRDNRSGEVRQMIAVKVEDFYDDEAERSDDYEEEFARAPKRKRPAKPTSGKSSRLAILSSLTVLTCNVYLVGRKGSKKMKKKQRRSFEDRREAWDQLWEEKFQELVRYASPHLPSAQQDRLSPPSPRYFAGGRKRKECAPSVKATTTRPWPGGFTNREGRCVMVRTTKKLEYALYASVQPPDLSNLGERRHLDRVPPREAGEHRIRMEQRPRRKGR